MSVSPISERDPTLFDNSDESKRLQQQNELLINEPNSELRIIEENSIIKPM
jgi:hypothetical protein